jgi:hypothetical protein
MDPATIAIATISVLSPYLKQAGLEIAKAVGDVGVEKAKALHAWLKERFAGDPAAAKDLSRFEQDPEKFEDGLQATLQEKAEAEPDFAAALQKRIDDIGPQLTIFARLKNSKNVVQLDADEIHSGKVSVTADADNVDGLTQVKLKTIG